MSQNKLCYFVYLKYYVIAAADWYEDKEFWCLTGPHWFVCFVWCGFPHLVLWSAQVTLSFGFGGMEPSGVFLCQPAYALTRECVFLAGPRGLASVLASTDVHLLPSRVSCSYTVVTAAGCLVGKDTQHCSGMFRERISCQKVSISAEIFIKKRKSKLVNDRSRSPIRQWSVVSERCVCISWLLKCDFNFKGSILPLSFLLSFSACLCSFLPFPSFSTCLSYFCLKIFSQTSPSIYLAVNIV